MHLKLTNRIASNNNSKTMASLKDDEQQSSSPTGASAAAAAASASATTTTSTASECGKRNNNNKFTSTAASASNNNNNNSNEEEAKAKKQTLEARKLELEQMLSEKSWLLQQIQKQETQILNGNYEYISLNEFFANLAQQYKQEQALVKSNNSSNNNNSNNNNNATTGVSGGSSTTPDSAILRRKQSNATASKENQCLNSNSNNNNNNRNSELSNRSSEYDNYQPNAMEANLTIGVQQQQTQQTIKSALKKRATPTPQASINYMQRQQQQQQLLLQQHIEIYPYASSQSPNVIVAATAAHSSSAQSSQSQHLHYPQQRTAMYAPQSPQQSPLQTHNHHHHQHPQFDGISLYSVNSANVATLRQQHVPPQQQPIIVQCDKYYLSPTHQSYSEGGFIKSSQNIKKYISPLGSPTTHHYEMPHSTAAATATSPHHHHQQLRQLDAISLAPSYVSMDAESIHQLRWRSQTHIGPMTPPHQSGSSSSNAASSGNMENATKAHSSDMLAHLSSNNSNSSTSQQPHMHQHFVNAMLLPPAPPPPVSKSKPLDEISHSTLNLNTDKKTTKSKQWLESSLDGPVMRSIDSPITTSGNSGSTKQPRERTKLSSQSMSASGGRHYSMSSARSGGTSSTTQAQAAAHALNTSGLPNNGKMLQHDDGRYAKLSQSTSYLNSMEQANAIGISASYPLEPLDLPLFRQLPPKPNATTSRHQQQPTPPPRPPPAVDKSTPAPLVSPPVVAVTAASLSPDIRIESPKNMTVVQQATFQPYKEVTKPFEMSDFYKYSTKFKQKEQANSAVRQVTPTHLDGN